MKGKSKGLQLSYSAYTLQLRHAFNLANNSRTTTPVVLVKIAFDGFCGYGEASLPPYLVENQASVISFLEKLDLSQFNDPFLSEDIYNYTDRVMAGNYAAKAAVDMAVLDLKGKISQLPLYKSWGLNPLKTPDTSFTIGIDTPEIIRQKVKEAEPYHILKVKLGRDNDRELIETIRAVTDKPLCVDVNQGWTDRQAALDNILWLQEKGVVFIEQPMSKTNIDDHAWLTQHSPLPIIADESFQGFADLEKIKGAYSGINIKLMKCGGLTPAHKIIHSARGLGMKVMLGCMTETSCAVTAAAHLSPLVDWADLDGNLLINNDPFDGLKIVDGKIVLPDRPGIGLKVIKNKTEISGFLL